MRLFYTVVIFLFVAQSFGQVIPKSEVRPKKDTIEREVTYPYVLPIWGQKLSERGIKFPKPFGISVNYIYTKMDLEITELTVKIGEVDITEYIPLEQINITQTYAGISGLNIRPDIYVFPFLNVYGLYSYASGYTQISFAPIIDETQMPEITPDAARFTVHAFGFGATASYGIKGWFFSFDGNMSWSRSAILQNDVAIVTASTRVGYNKVYKNKMGWSIYIGAMYRNFLNDKPTKGSIKVSDIFPDLESKIDSWYEDLRPGQQQLAGNLRDDIQARVGGPVYEETIDYSIKKELINGWTGQVGAQWQINESWFYRAEFGISPYQLMLITGINYRFGIRKGKHKATKDKSAQG